MHARIGWATVPYTLTLDVYADYIPEVETENPLPEPVAPPARATNVVSMFG